MRLAVIGTSGAGKSTLAKKVSKKLSIKYIEQDKYYWLPNWQTVPIGRFMESIRKEISEESWTICGNHSNFQEEIWKRATHLVWLNYPLSLLLTRGLRRTIRRVFLKETCCNGNHEGFRHAFLSKNSILWWILTTYKDRIEKYENAKYVGKFNHLEFLEFKNPKETENWLKQIEPNLVRTIL